jgi:Caspase domain
MTLVFSDSSDAPGLHALVIGVGCYEDGVGATANSLKSAPNSALAIATWLRDEYRSTESPLRSLELLVSPANPDPEVKIEFSGKSVQRAYMGQAKPQGPFPAYGLAKAVKEWKDRGTASEKNMTLFYFCGHGVHFQGSPHLLVEGFASKSDAPFEASLNFSKFFLGMEMCLARRQMYIVDACRDVPSWLMSKQNTAPGRGLLELDVDRLPINLAPRNAPIFYAASDMQRAGSNDGSISRFTKAFLEVMRGPACARTGKPRTWRVSTDRIITSILDLRDRAILGDWMGQTPRLGGESASFDFHVPEKPVVPVIVRKPLERPSSAITVDGAGCAILNEKEWLGQAAIGGGIVSAENAEGTLASIKVDVEPAYIEVDL